MVLTMSKPTLAIFGATGGSTLAFLVRALQSGYNCNALVRTPSKLTGLLAANNVSSEIVSKHLSIIQGNVKDVVKVAEALLVDGELADMIISGVGGTPVFMPNPLRPTLDDPNICEDATNTIIKAVKQVQLASSLPKRPVMIVVSGTEISDKGRDIPLVMIPLYHLVLPIPHKDKKMMERALEEETRNPSTSALKGFITVRPSLLTDGNPIGVKKIRTGIEEEGKVNKAAIGYTISRKDVGGWMFEELVDNKDGAKYLNHFVAITA